MAGNGLGRGRAAPAQMEDYYSDDAEPLDAAERLRYVFVERVRCPKCGTSDIKTSRSTKQADGSVTRHTDCRRCQHHFFVIVE